jgi:hypothetical protein
MLMGQRWPEARGSEVVEAANWHDNTILASCRCSIIVYEHNVEQHIVVARISVVLMYYPSAGMHVKFDITYLLLPTMFHAEHGIMYIWPG